MHSSAQFLPLQREIACVTTIIKTNAFKNLCLLGPEIEIIKKAESLPGCDTNYVNKNNLCSLAKTPETPTPPPESQVLTPSTESPVCNPTVAVTSGTTQFPLTRYTTEKLTPEPPPQVPKELEDYEELDGDEYDPDFPTVPPRKYYFY